MKKIIFRKDIYTNKSIKRACDAYKNHADIEVDEKDDAYVVSIVPKPNSPLLISDEFINYVIVSLA